MEVKKINEKSFEVWDGEVRVGTGITEIDALEDAKKNGNRARLKAQFRKDGLTGAELVAAVDAAVAVANGE